MLDRIPGFVRVGALLAVFALGSALGLNAVIAKVLSVDPQKLADARAGAPGKPVPTVVSNEGEAVADAGGGSEAAVPATKPPLIIGFERRIPEMRSRSVACGIRSAHS